MNDPLDDPPAVLATLLSALEAHLGTAGRELADAIPYGALLSGGEKKPNSTQRWFYVLATNDAATDLEAFAVEQVKGRREAAMRAGITCIVSE